MPKTEALDGRDIEKVGLELWLRQTQTELAGKSTQLRVAENIGIALRLAPQESPDDIDISWRIHRPRKAIPRRLLLLSLEYSAKEKLRKDAACTVQDIG